MQPDLVFVLGPILAVNIASWLTPGPNMLAVISASLTHGRRQGIATGLGIAFGGTLWATLAVSGATAAFALFPDAVLMLRLAGAGYLIWLGVRALTTALRGGSELAVPVSTAASGWRAFRSGFLVIATNPKAALFFGSILTAFVPTGAPPWFLLAVVLISSAVGVIGHSLTATLFSTRTAIGAFRAGYRRITALFGLLFCGLGIGVAYDACRRL